MKRTNIGTGYGIVQRDFMKLKEFDVYEKAVYALLCSYAGGKGECWPSKVTLRRDLGISKDKLNKSLKNLHDAGWIGISQSQGGGHGNTNSYFPYHLTGPCELPRTPDVPQGAATRTPGGIPDVPQGAAVRYTKNNNKNNNKNNTISAAKDKSLDGGSIEADSLHSFYYKQAVEEYFNFYKQKNSGNNPKFNGADGKAMKEILTYFRLNADKETYKTTKDRHEYSVHCLKIIFKNYDKLDNWLQNNIDIKNINSKLNSILNTLRNGNTKKRQPDSNVPAKSTDWVN